jgi:SOS response regulatory protein OraA/RecX
MTEFDKREDGTLSEKGEEQMKKLQFEYISFVFKTMAEITPEQLADMVYNVDWHRNEDLINKVNAIYQKLMSLEMPIDTSEHSRGFGMELVGRVWNSIEHAVAQEKENLIRMSVGKKEYRDITLADVVRTIKQLPVLSPIQEK